MLLKLLGGGFIVLGCGGYGIMLASAHKRELRCLDALMRAIDRISCELQYRLLPLPDLCQQAAAAAGGTVGEFFLQLQRELNKQISPSATDCALLALNETRSVPELIRELLLQLGASLGQFDVEGQLKGLEAVRALVEEKKGILAANMDVRLRSYQTLGLCAGASLAILFM